MIHGTDSGTATGNHGIRGQDGDQLLLQAGVLLLQRRDAFDC